MTEPPDNRDWQISLRALMLSSVFVGAFLFINFQCEGRTAFAADLLILLALIFSLFTFSANKNQREFKVAVAEFVLFILILGVCAALIFYFARLHSHH